MQDRTRFAWLFLILVLVAFGARADTPTEAAEPTESAPEATSEENVSVVKLSLAQAIDSALVSNLDLQLKRFVPEIAREQLEQAKGIYDPNFFAKVGYESSQTPQAIFFGGAPPEIPLIEQRKIDGSSGIDGEIPMIGARYGITYIANETKSTVTGQPLFTPSLSPANSTHLEATLSIPLLRDLFWNRSWTQIQSTKLAHKGTRENFRRALMDTVRDTENAYWDLIATREKLRVDTKSLETSRALLEQTKAQYEVGTVSKVAVTEADAGVAERELNQIVSENTYRAAQDQLINLIFGERLTVSSDLRIEPSDELANVKMHQVDASQAMQKAEQYRPEIAAAAYEIKRRKVELRFAKNQRLPRFDVDSRYAYDGLTGVNDEYGRTYGNFGDAHDNFLSTAGPHTWSTKGTFSIPLGNRVASHRLSQSTIELRQATTQMKRVQQGIVLEVRKVVRDLHSTELGIRASDRRAAAAREQLRAEQVRLQYGDSTPFDVLQKERDLVDAESQRISAYQLYRTSLAEFERAQGTILQSHHIRIDQP